jgi:hypothetical protein
MPAFHVGFTNQLTIVQPLGIGPSIVKEEALLQALFESVLVFDRHNSDAEERREKLCRQRALQQSELG